MSTVKQIRIGTNGSLLDIESVNDSQHTNFATSAGVLELAQRISTLENTVNGITIPEIPEIPDLTELTEKVNALEALNLQTTIANLQNTIGALTDRIYALENPSTPVTPVEPEETPFSQYVVGFEAGSGNYGLSADGIDQTQNQNKLEITTSVDENDNSIKNIVLTGDVSQLVSWTSTNPSQASAQHKWFALDFIFNSETLEGLKWNGDTIQNDWFDAPNMITLWLKIDDVLENGKTVVLTDANDENSETFNISIVNEGYITDFHAGTANYGNSEDGVNQRLNQDKLAISTSIENDITYVTLAGDVSLLTSWMSTNINQQDATHKWYGLDFVFDANKLENLTWNGSAIQNDWFDEPEGPNTITLWLKVDEVLNEEKTVTLSNGTDTQTIKVRIVNTFEAKTYNFTSYSDANGGNENIWATGTVVTTGNNATFGGVNYVEAEVKTNTIEGWVGRTFYIPADAQTDGTIYQLHDVNGELVGVWVSITE